MSMGKNRPLGCSLLNPAQCTPYLTCRQHNLGKPVKVGHGWKSRLQDPFETSKWMLYKYPLWWKMICSAVFVFVCCWLCLFVCLFSDLLKPFFVEEHQNKPFNFVSPAGGWVPIHSSSDEYFTEKIIKMLYEILRLTQNFLCLCYPQSSDKVKKTSGICKLILIRVTVSCVFLKRKQTNKT